MLTWERFGVAVRELATLVADSSFRPEVHVAVARGGLILGGGLLLQERGAEARSAVLFGKPGSVVTPDYVWRQTDKWIVFPWSAEPPVSGAQVTADPDAS